MSVLIRGMEMPREGTVMVVCEVNGQPCVVVRGAEPYPLVPVPPHGLIDREQILDSIRLELAQANAVNDMEDYDSWVRVFDYVRKFPTTIPAEEVE